MKWVPASLIPEDVQSPDLAFNLKTIVSQLQGTRGQHVTNGSGGDWRIVSPKSAKPVDGALLFQRKGMDPITRKPRWRTVASFSSSGMIVTTTQPKAVDITTSSPYMTSTEFQFMWSSDGTVTIRGAVSVNGAADGTVIADGVPAPAAAEPFQVLTSSGTMIATINTDGEIVAGTIGGATTITFPNIRYRPAASFDMRADGQEPQQ